MANKSVDLVFPAVVISAGSTLSVPLPNPNHTRGYWVVQTSDIVMSPSLIIFVRPVLLGGEQVADEFELAETAPITTALNTIYYLGWKPPDADKFAEAFQAPLIANVQFDFVVSGTGSITVASALELIIGDGYGA